MTNMNTLEEPFVPYKFENLDVWKISLELSDEVYLIIDLLPSSENFNLKSQLQRAVTSISLNIAEGSTYATPGDQKKYIRIAIHSLIEVVGIFRIIQRRKYLKDENKLGKAEEISTKLFRMLIAYDRSIH